MVAGCFHLMLCRLLSAFPSWTQPDFAHQLATTSATVSRGACQKQERIHPTLPRAASQEGILQAAVPGAKTYHTSVSRRELHDAHPSVPSPPRDRPLVNQGLDRLLPGLTTIDTSEMRL